MLANKYNHGEAETQVRDKEETVKAGLGHKTIFKALNITWTTVQSTILKNMTQLLTYPSAAKDQIDT